MASYKELEILKSCSFLYEENLATLIALRGSSLKASEVFRKIFFAISFDPLQGSIIFPFESFAMEFMVRSLLIKSSSRVMSGLQ